MLRVVPATGSRLIPALHILYEAMPLDERTTRIAESAQAAAAGELDLSLLLLAELSGKPVGALLLRMQPSEVAFVWAPIVSGDLANVAASLSVKHAAINSEIIEDALLQAAVQSIEESNAWIGQSLLELPQLRERAAFSRNGFRHLTNLRFFECPVATDHDTVTPITGELKDQRNYIAYRRTRNRLRFANVIEQTYRGSLDCPEMNGIRSASQSLKVYEASGPVIPDMWRVYWHEKNDVGVILMVDHSEQKTWEVIYLGVVESARRQGIARDMLTKAMQAARAAQVERLLIVVDSRNLPAIRLYESLGFTQFDIRAAYIRLAPTGQ